MTSKLKISLVSLGILVLLIGSYSAYSRLVIYPNEVAELRDNPQGKRAARVLLLSLPSGKEIPVNYLYEGNTVYLGADGRWWNEFHPEPANVSLLIKGQQLSGSAHTVLDDQPFIDEIFARLRPTVPSWLPDALNGKLVVITLSKG